MKGYLSTTTKGEVLHRHDCGHGQRAFTSGNAVEVRGFVARIVLLAVLASADEDLSTCGHCKPDTRGLEPKVVDA